MTLTHALAGSNPATPVKSYSYYFLDDYKSDRNNVNQERQTYWLEGGKVTLKNFSKKS